MLLKDCELCPERKYAKEPVPGSGPLDASILLLGRNPGKDEDRGGRPFIGRAGVKLNEGLAIAKLPRSECRIDNISKCMTPKDITPSQQCQRICSQTWLTPQLQKMPNLEVVVTLGNQALHYFEPLGTVGELHGTVFRTMQSLPDDGINIVTRDLHIFVSYHPSAALRSSLMNKHFMNDMLKLHKYLHTKYPDMIPE